MRGGRAAGRGPCFSLSFSHTPASDRAQPSSYDATRRCHPANPRTEALAQGGATGAMMTTPAIGRGTQRRRKTCRICDSCCGALAWSASTSHTPQLRSTLRSHRARFPYPSEPARVHARAHSRARGTVGAVRVRRARRALRRSGWSACPRCRAQSRRHDVEVVATCCAALRHVVICCDML